MMRKLLFLLLLSPAICLADQTVTLSVPGMNCPVCPITLSKALERVEGVKVLSVDIKTNRIVVRAPDSVTVSQLTEATESAGYPSHIVLTGEHKP